MTIADWVLVGAIFIGFYAVAIALGQTNKHLSNIADRLLDIERAMRGKPE